MGGKMTFGQSLREQRFIYWLSVLKVHSVALVRQYRSVCVSSSVLLVSQDRRVVPAEQTEEFSPPDGSRAQRHPSLNSSHITLLIT